MPDRPEHHDETGANRRLRFELIFGSVWLAIGLFLLPAVIYIVGTTLLGSYGEGQGAGLGTFYGDFFGDLAQGEARAWALALGPLVVISLIRLLFLGTREPAAPSSENVEPHRKSAEQGEHRRVEPSVGTD